jgi:hypothetical protein
MMAADREGRAPGEPANGDFVAYVEAIERRQLAEMSRPHALAHPSPGSGAATTQARNAVRAASGARAGRTARPLSTGSLLMLIAGALALANALFGDGGIIAFVIGVALLWQPVRRMIDAVRAAVVTAARPRQAVDATFANKPSQR